MASHSRNSGQNQEHSYENGVDTDVAKRIIEGLNEIELTIDQLRQEFHKSLDLNQTVSDSALIEEGCLMEETKVTEMEAGDGQIANIDLNLSLSPPNGKPNGQESSNQSENSSPKSQRSCMSLDLNVSAQEDQESTNPRHANLPSLILMGCTHCYIYVMVSEADPKCPKCSSSVLLDMFRESPAKKSRKN
ncbi:protein GL2-INTERACTING REPRESSOR 1 [Citrus sinensis]|nr:protein GL2-INTERACTING REPRESSOR 1 [Citrus sinensis]